MVRRLATRDSAVITGSVIGLVAPVRLADAKAQPRAGWMSLNPWGTIGWDDSAESESPALSF